MYNKNFIQPQVGVFLEGENHKTVKNQKVKTVKLENYQREFKIDVINIILQKKGGPREEKIPNDRKQKL